MRWLPAHKLYMEKEIREAPPLFPIHWVCQLRSYSNPEILRVSVIDTEKHPLDFALFKT